MPGTLALGHCCCKPDYNFGGKANVTETNLSFEYIALKWLDSSVKNKTKWTIDFIVLLHLLDVCLPFFALHPFQISWCN